MKALICELCNHAAPVLLEVRAWEGGRRSKKSHFCPQCLESALRRHNHTKRHNIDIPLDPADLPRPSPKVTAEQMD